MARSSRSLGPVRSGSLPAASGSWRARALQMRRILMSDMSSRLLSLGVSARRLEMEISLASKLWYSP